MKLDLHLSPESPPWVTSSQEPKPLQSGEAAKNAAFSFIEKMRGKTTYIPHSPSPEGERGDFYRWLNSNEEGPFFNPLGKYYAMDSVDFVYLVLVHEGVISKERALYNYQRYFGDQGFERKANDYYGFNLAKFAHFDIKEGPEWGQHCQPGDFLIGFSGGKPVVCVFLSEKNERWDWWCGLGLWDKYSPSLDSALLMMVQEEHQSELTFRWCPFERVISDPDFYHP